MNGRRPNTQDSHSIYGNVHKASRTHSTVQMSQLKRFNTEQER